MSGKKIYMLVSFILLFVAISGCSKKENGLGDEKEGVLVENDKVNGEEAIADTEENGEVEEEKAEVINNGRHFVDYGGDVYYWEYNEESFENEGLSYAGNPEAMNSLVRLSRDGVREVVLTDIGNGKLVIIDDRIYYQSGYEWDENSSIYSVNLEGGDRKEIGKGNILDVDEGNESIICRKGQRLSIIDCRTGEEKIVTEMGEYLILDNGVLYFKDNEEVDGEKSGIVHFKSISLDDMSVKRVEVAEDLAREDLGADITSDINIVQIQVLNDYIYFSYGTFGGTAYNYQGGKIARVKTDGSDFQVLAGNGRLVDYTFYLLEEKKKNYLIYNMNFSGGDKTDEVFSLSLENNQEKKIDFINQKMGEPFMLDEGISLYPDRSGEMIRLINREDYSDFEGDIGIVGEIKLEIKNIEYMGDWVYYVVEKGLHKEDLDIGWRYGFRRERTSVYRKNLKESSVEEIYSY